MTIHTLRGPDAYTDLLRRERLASHFKGTVSLSHATQFMSHYRRMHNPPHENHLIDHGLRLDIGLITCPF